jgi:hypothetical protein
MEKQRMDATTPKVLGPRDGTAGFLGSIGVRFMIDGSESGGGFSLVEHPMSPRALGAPLHRHAREYEYSYVTRKHKRPPKGYLEHHGGRPRTTIKVVGKLSGSPEGHGCHFARIVSTSVGVFP